MAILSQRTSIKNSNFFGRMVEFGFLDSTANNLPDDFTLVYEIARILEDTQNPLTSILSPVLWLIEHDETKKSQEKHIIPHLPSGDEYEANLISSYRDIARIYPHQFLLPDEVLMQKLVERSLWMPSPKAPRNFRYQSESNQFAPDSRKQKVYVLFDTSKSMQELFRIHLAKGIAYFFLKNNQREMGTIFFRTFDAELGPLQIVNDKLGFDELIANIMGMPAEGRGTILEKAIITAINDIRLDSFMSDADILVITDGAAHIDVDKVRMQLGDTISINCVKIGKAILHPDTKIILNAVHTSESEDAKSIRELQHKMKDLEYSLKATQTESRKLHIQSELSHLSKQVQDKIQRFAAKSMSNYGNEIVELSNVFVNVDDVNPEKLFALSKERIQDFLLLSRELLDILKNDPSVEDAKHGAVLYDHLKILLQYNNVDTEDLSNSTKELGDILTSFVQQQKNNIQHTNNLDLSDDDQIQLSKLLKSGMSKAARIPLARLLLIVYRKIIKNIKQWQKARQIKKLRTMKAKSKRRPS